MSQQHLTIVICYKEGTLDMLRVCLDSIERHTQEVPHKILIATLKCEDELHEWGYQVEMVPEPDYEVVVNKLHGYMLDYIIPAKVETELFMTMDSDCFPVADGWLTELLEMQGECCGVLHPWSPSDGEEFSSIAKRIRDQHCWLSTHVACQLLSLDYFKSLDVKFNAGDDTGLLIPKMLREKGDNCNGFKPSHCPQMEGAEFNRYVCLIYGGKLYHQGGFTRVAYGDEHVFEDIEKQTWERIKKENGAEWLLEEGHQFKFDREDDVFRDKMARLFGYKVETHNGHDSYMLP